MSATEFNSLGLGTLIPSDCIIYEELNGLYELEMVHIYDKWGKWKNLKVENIIFANGQPFRIYSIKPKMETKSITVYARHIFYDLIGNYIESASIGSSLAGFSSSFNYTQPFTFSSDISASGTFVILQTNPVNALLGEGGYIATFGGEIKRNGHSVEINALSGVDRGFKVSYGKNLIGLEVEEDTSGVVTRLINADGDVVDSPYIDSYPYPKVLYSEEFTDFSSGIDLPVVNAKVDFQLLSKTEEYKEYSLLEDVQLGDLVTVVNSKMNFEKKAQVISYEWDCLLERYNEIELGDFVADITESISVSVTSSTTASTEVKQIINLINGTVTIESNYLYINVTDISRFRFGATGLQFTANDGSTWTTLITSGGVIEVG